MLFFFFFPFTSAWIIDKRPYSTARNYNKLLRIPSGVWQTGQHTTAVHTKRTACRLFDVFEDGGRERWSFDPMSNWYRAVCVSARHAKIRTQHSRACSSQSVYRDRFCDRVCRLVIPVHNMARYARFLEMLSRLVFR